MKGCWKSVMVLAMLAQGVFAGPAVEKRDPVAEGFPDWQGLTSKNHLTGRTLYSRTMTPSDLRHKVVVVIELDVTDLKKFQTEQLPLAARIARYNSYFIGGLESSLGSYMDGVKVPRTTVVLLSLRGKPSAGVVDAFFAPKDKDLTQKIAGVTSSYCPIYYEAGMVGEPENAEGKYPFAYVIGAKNNEPLWKGVLTEKAATEVVTTIQKARKDLPEWTPMTGVAEAQYHKAAFKQIKEGKFKAAQKSLLGGIKSKDAESAAEAQKMYDAIQQYQTDTIHLIENLVSVSPALAYCELVKFMKVVPTAKKSLAAKSKVIAATPGSQQLGDIITKYRLWTSEDYKPKNAGEVKKNVAEIAKWKKIIAQFEKSDNMKVQGDAMYLNSILESLQATMESKVAK